MSYQLGFIDTLILVLYAVVLVGMGIYFLRKSNTSEEFMVAGRGIPAWAAGIAVMSAYTSSISYIAVPGKAFDSNWHPLIFALATLPVAWFVTKYVIPHYRKNKIISVYNYLEQKMGTWARVYASLSFVLFMIGRTAVILYLSSLLLTSFIDMDIKMLILVIGLVTVLYTLMGGMEAVIWTDVMQSIIMVGGLLFSAYVLTKDVLVEPGVVKQAFEAHKFSLGDTQWSLSSRTIWVMIIYGITENIRNLIADQNYTQKYSSTATEKEAKRSVWFAMLIYIPLTIVFLYIGTMLYIYYGVEGHGLPDAITKGDQVFPHFIATQLPVGLKGLIIAAILAASMSTIDSALNSSATVLFVDYYKKFFKPDASEQSSLNFLRITTVVWGILGIAFALLLINAESALDIWWQISGIFGGGILGLFLLAVFNVKVTTTQGVVSTIFSVVIIIWGSFMRNMPAGWEWIQCTLDPIIIGAVSTAGLVLLALIFVLINRSTARK